MSDLPTSAVEMAVMIVQLQYQVACLAAEREALKAPPAVEPSGGWDEETVKRQVADFNKLVDELYKLQAEREALKAERDAARGCPHGDNCACAIGSRHSWLEAFSDERKAKETAEAEVRRLREEANSLIEAAFNADAEATILRSERDRMKDEHAQTFEVLNRRLEQEIELHAITRAEVRRLREALDKLLGPKCPCKCSDEPWHQRGVCRFGEDMLVSALAPTPPEGQP